MCVCTIFLQNTEESSTTLRSFLIVLVHSLENYIQTSLSCSYEILRLLTKGLFQYLLPRARSAIMQFQKSPGLKLNLLPIYTAQLSMNTVIGFQEDLIRHSAMLSNVIHKHMQEKGKDKLPLGIECHGPWICS